MGVATGVRQLWGAKYTNAGTAVTYDAPLHIARLVSVKPSVEVSDEKKFYADDGPSESAGGKFTNGSVAIVVDGLPSAVRQAIEAAQIRTINGVTVTASSADDNAGYMGIGWIEREMMEGATKFIPVVLPKVKFSQSVREVQTQEDEIEFQTLELSATIFRDDTADHNWRLIADQDGGYETDAEALVALKVLLGASAG